MPVTVGVVLFAVDMDRTGFLGRDVLKSTKQSNHIINFRALHFELSCNRRPFVVTGQAQNHGSD